MRPKIQLSTHDVEFQRQERAKSDQMRRQLLIPQEKVPSIIKFKPPTFIFPPPKDIVLLKNNHPTSSPSNPGSSSFFLKKNLFSLPKITLLFWRKEKEPLPPSSSSFSFHVVTIVEVVAVDDVVVVEVTITAATCASLNAAFFHRMSLLVLMSQLSESSSRQFSRFLLTLLLVH